jgi:diaminopimelate epimerase
MKIDFTKMSGAGNDFVFLGPDYARHKDRASDLARALCPRGTSVGADGLILVENSGGAIFMHYYNSDGSEASFCGNGARCLVLFCGIKGIASGRMEFRSGSGAHTGEVTDRGVRVSMDAPRFVEDLIIRAGGEAYQVSLVQAGVPHAVIFLEGLADIDVEGIGSAIRHRDEFAPDGANVDFVEPAVGHYLIRTFERGVEKETLACGSGCVAAAHALRLKRGAGGVIDLKVASGDILSVELPGEVSELPGGASDLPGGQPDIAYLVGPARVVYEGHTEFKEI